MIVQCEQCQAKFRLDDSKVTDKGVKVRCSKCKHVFTVAKEPSEAETFDFGPSHEDTALSQPGENTASLQPLEVLETTPPFSFNTDFLEEAADKYTKDEVMDSRPFAAAASDSSFALAGNDEFSLSSLAADDGFAVERDEATATHGEVDFDSFDFGDRGADADKTMIAPPSADFGESTVIQPLSAEKEDVQGLDFADGDKFGTATPPPAEEFADSGAFDFAADNFAASMDMNTAEAELKSSLIQVESAAVEPFSLGEMDFGDEVASDHAQRVYPDEQKQSQELFFAPSPEAHEIPEPAADDHLKQAIDPEAAQLAQDDMPPLSIASRRKESSVSGGLIAVLVLLVIGVLGYVGFTLFSDNKSKVVQETGKISVRAVKATYVKNVAAGALLVISGEAVNEYSKPRAALQVKGVIFDAKGLAIASKSAFGGNMLTDEQLASLPLEKIEAVMANQFGDSLVNMEVAPGKAVSFMVVIANPPKEGKDFGVEPVGSTVATGKQQK